MDSKKRDLVKLGLCLASGATFITACGGGGTAETGSGTGPTTDPDPNTTTNPGPTTSRNARVTGTIALPDEFGIVGVTVGGRSTASDASGNFELREVPPGNQRFFFDTGRNAELSKQSGVVFQNIPVRTYDTEPVAVPEQGELQLNGIQFLAGGVLVTELITTDSAGDTSVQREVFLDARVTGI
ncbi:MAG: hypothetical protein KTR18_05020 [Acidiferrobacterales bacterium]|nr:hypothetical protein [Acidiferrobacterales bacterium]